MTETLCNLAARFKQVRAQTLYLTEKLSAEDQCVQSMPDASPSKWHLAHTTWFFEALLLAEHDPEYRFFDSAFTYLYNSYYEALGPRHPRHERGLLTRPSLEEILQYRAHVDQSIGSLLAQASEEHTAEIARILELGLHHEEQHQELILTDALHLLSCNPLLPTFAADFQALRCPAGPAQWSEGPCGIVNVGHDGQGFAYDNEMPRHGVLLHPYLIADRLVTCGEYAAFIEDGGYQRHSLWLSDGWAMVKQMGYKSPAYWFTPDELLTPPPGDAPWYIFDLGGLHPIQAHAPVANLSVYEAAAYAEWAGARLPTEFEWEASYHLPAIHQMTGHLWQWTRSAYGPYPGFQPMSGAAGEYNGKFMMGQLVLRGSSHATPAGHTRPSYRNFFPPSARWQFTGIRLACNLPS